MGKMMQTKTRPLITAEQIEQYSRDGFLVVENLFDSETVARLIARFDPLFAGEFETGVYPDEWHWNPYLGKPGRSGAANRRLEMRSHLSFCSHFYQSGPNGS